MVFPSVLAVVITFAIHQDAAFRVNRQATLGSSGSKPKQDSLRRGNGNFSAGMDRVSANKFFVLARIVSGGGTGADRAGLDAALKLGIPCGGWCPAGRRADDGVISSKYPLQETPTRNYMQRTEWNVRDSDGTVLLVWQRIIPGGGTYKTKAFADKIGKPVLIVDISDPDPSMLATWCTANSVRVLNVAGPRESADWPIYEASLEFLLKARPACASVPELAESPAAGGLSEKKRTKLQKALRQIDDLKEKEQQGVKLEKTQQGKIAREEELRAELEALNKEAADAGDAAGDEGIDMSAAIAGIPGL